MPHLEPDIAAEIFLAISTMPKGLKDLCALNPHWPKMSVIVHSILQDPSLGESYARAKMLQIGVLVESLFSEIDNAENDFYEDNHGKKYVNHAHINRVRLKVDTIKWLAGKLAPKIYGDKLQLEKLDNNADPELLRVKELVQQLKNS